MCDTVGPSIYSSVFEAINRISYPFIEKVVFGRDDSLSENTSDV